MTLEWRHIVPTPHWPTAVDVREVACGLGVLFDNFRRGSVCLASSICV